MSMEKSILKKDKKLLIILLVVFGLIILSLGGYIIYDKFIVKENKNNNNDSNNNQDGKDKVTQLQKGTFQLSSDDGMGGYGNLQVEGYVTVEKRNDCYEFCDGNEPQVDYIFFNILRIENPDFFKVFDDSGNSFIGKDSIGIGCVNNDVISYYNNSIANGFREYKLLPVDSVKILNSTKEKPIILELNRLLMEGGGGAPTCYSHITTINVIK